MHKCTTQDLIGRQVPVMASLGPQGFMWEDLHEEAACGLCYTRCAHRARALPLIHTTAHMLCTDQVPYREYITPQK